jgi:hypothetical protein
MVYGLALNINLKVNEQMSVKDSRKLLKRLSLFGIVLCGACCFVPIATIMFGAGSMAVVNGYLESAGVLTMFIGVVFLGIKYFKKRQVRTCDVNCSCKAENGTMRTQKK